MRLLIHSINYAPELTGIGKYTGEMAEWLARRGHDVRVVTAPPYYPAWRVDDAYRTFSYKLEQMSGVDVWRCPLWVPKSPTAFKRVIHLLSFAISSFPVMLMQIFWRPDIIIVIEPPVFCAPQSLLTAYLSNSKAWLHIQDFEVEAFFGLGFASPSYSLKKGINALEGWLMRRFDHVSSISKSMVARVALLNVPKNRTSLFPNWVDTKLISPDPKGRDLRKEWGFEDSRKIVLYSGNMGKKQGLEMVIEAAQAFQKTVPDLLFVMVGDGADKANLARQVKERDLENVIFKPLQPLETLPSLLAMADIHLVIQKRGVADAVLPSKLSSILAAGGFAIITADKETDLGRFVLDNPGIAVLVEPENVEEFKKTIINILADSRFKKINVTARSYAERYLDTDIILSDFEKEIIDLVQGK